MNIVEYVVENYNKLPKSHFNDEECVMVKIIENQDYGYGHHAFEGVGIDKDGNLLWCYSSGCSCDGSCGMAHTTEGKILVLEDYDLSNIDLDNFNFENLQVEFYNY